ncbi:MAG: insulinase family protein, partial [Candidatus Hydrogenedentota bacterium]
LEGGRFEEPDKKLGLTTLWGNCVTYSGSKLYPREKLSAQLENHASNFNFSAGLERSLFSLSALTPYFQKDFTTTWDVLNHPRFFAEDCSLLKKQLTESIQERDKNPGRLAFLIRKLQFWKGSVRARLYTKKTLENITSQDFLAWHKKNFQAARMSIAVAGNFQVENIVKLLNQTYGKMKWDSSTYPDKTPLEKNPANPKQKAFFYAKQIPQTSILFFAKGIPHAHKDYIPLKVFDYLLGGSSFQSFLMQDIRVKRGWAYSVYSFYTAGSRFGSLGIFGQTANQNVPSYTKRVEQILQESPTLFDEKKLNEAKTSIKNKFVFLYKTPAEYLWLYLSLKWEKMPPDYLQTFVENVEKVKLKEIQEIARKYYHPERFSKVFVGPKKSLPENTKLIPVQIPK